MLEAGALFALRAFGLLYLVGGLFAVRQMWQLRTFEVGLEALHRQAQAFWQEGDAPLAPSSADVGRMNWLIAGGVLTALSGAAMLAASRFAVPLLAALVVHQLLYFARQRRRELSAPNAEAAADAQPERSTRNAAFVAFAIAVVSAWLLASGKLR